MPKRKGEIDEEWGNVYKSLIRLDWAGWATERRTLSFLLFLLPRRSNEPGEPCHEGGDVEMEERDGLDESPWHYSALLPHLGFGAGCSIVAPFRTGEREGSLKEHNCAPSLPH